MLRQAGRPMSNSVPRSERRNPVWGNPDRINEPARGRSPAARWNVDPELHKLTIERNVKAREAILNWNPLEAELKQRFNNANTNPRSRLAAPSREAFDDALNPFVRKLRNELISANASLPGGRNAKIDHDVSELVSDKMASEIKGQLFRYLDAKAKSSGRSELARWDLPGTMNYELRKMGNDLLYEWNETRRQGMLNMLDASRMMIKPVEHWSQLKQ
jgi:hypothetical protein